jgi:ribonuclease J
LTRYGAEVIHQGIAPVHVSGHAPAGELLYLFNAVRPSNVMPVHGEWRHLRAAATLAEQTGVPADRIVIAEDGLVVDLVDGRASITGAVPAGYVYVDGLVVGDIGDASLKDRRILGDEGFLSITVVVDSASGKVVAGPDVMARGVSDDPDAFDPLRSLVDDALSSALGEGIGDVRQLQQLVRRTAGRWVSDTFRRRPMIVPTVVEV